MGTFLGSHSGLLSRTRPKSAYCGSAATLSVAGRNNEPLENNQEEVEKPILRRERTFDLDPKPNSGTASKKIVEVVNIDIEDNSHNNDHGEEELEQNNGK